MTRGLLRTAFAVLVSGPALAQGVSFNTGNFVPGLSQVVPTTATTVIPAAAGNNGKRFRVVALDTACQTGGTVTVWCAWGTQSSNPAVIGSNGFPLACGIDDSGPGVNQSAMNCIQAAGGGHYVRIEAY